MLRNKNLKKITENFPKLIKPGLDKSPKFPLTKLKNIFKVNVLIVEPKNLIY